MSTKENSVGAISGGKKGKINNFKGGLFWAGWDTQGQTHSSLFKKSSLQSPSISVAEQPGIALISDIYSSFVGSWPLSQWFILENEHTHTWLIIFGKYLNNLGVRQERAKVVKSMLTGTENGTGGWAPGVDDKGTGWVPEPMWTSTVQPENTIFLTEMVGRLVKCLLSAVGTLRNACSTHIYVHLCNFRVSEHSEQINFYDNHHYCPHPWKGLNLHHWEP